jgi:hypothetical protein
LGNLRDARPIGLRPISRFRVAAMRRSETAMSDIWIGVHAAAERAYQPLRRYCDRLGLELH